MSIYLVAKNKPKTDLFEYVMDSPYTEATLDEVKKFLDSSVEFAIDVETSWKYKGKYNYAFKTKWGRTTPNPNSEGLDPYLSKIVMIQVGNYEEQYVVDARDYGVDWIKPYLEDKSKLKIGQNLKFEYKQFKSHGIIMESLFDTMIAEKVLYTGRQLDCSLKGLIKRYIGVEVDKGTRLEFALIGKDPFTVNQIIYGAEDVKYPFRIKETQDLDLDRKQVRKCFSLESRFIPVLGDIEYNGMNFNQSKWFDNYIENKKLTDEALNALNSYVIETFADTEFVDKQLDLFSEDQSFTCRILWSSQKQVLELFHYLGLYPEDKNKPSLNAKVLQSFKMSIVDDKKKWLVEKFINYKELAQATNTFGEKYFKYVHPITKRLHSNYNQILETGRISSSSPNLQNIPAKQGFRRAFDAPTGWKIVNADYSGQEQIILANKSQDKELQAFYLQGHSDMHSFIASKIYPELADLPLDVIKAEHKDKRQVAKAAGFAINYGGTGYTIAKNLGIDEQEGDEVYDAYFRAFPNLKKYFDRVQSESLANGYILIDPITQRKNWFRRPENNKERNAILKKALNYPIQGEAGGITKLAPILFRDWIIENNLQDKVLITNLVHDEINIEVKEEYAEEAAKNLERTMKQAADLWCKTIKLSADAVVTTYWNH